MIIKSRVRIVFVPRVPPASFEVNGGGIVLFLQSRLFALRANLKAVVSVVLKNIKFLFARRAFIRIYWHITTTPLQLDHGSPVALRFDIQHVSPCRSL
jgi:hypothetical protein